MDVQRYLACCFFDEGAVLVKENRQEVLKRILVKAHEGPLQTACLDEVGLVLVENAEFFVWCVWNSDPLPHDRDATF